MSKVFKKYLFLSLFVGVSLFLFASAFASGPPGGSGPKQIRVEALDGNVWTINLEGRGDVVQHSHVDSGILHFDVTLAASTNFILVDMSDTTNYPHSNTTYIHLEWLRIHVSADNAAAYELELGFLESVDADSSDMTMFSHVFGTKTVGTSKEVFLNFYPNGGRLRSANVVSHDFRDDDATFDTSGSYKTTLDPTTADTAAGSGDMVLLVTDSGGNYDIVIDMAYHSH